MLNQNNRIETEIIIKTVDFLNCKIEVVQLFKPNTHIEEYTFTFDTYKVFLKNISNEYEENQYRITSLT